MSVPGTYQRDGLASTQPSGGVAGGPGSEQAESRATAGSEQQETHGHGAERTGS